MKMFETIDSQVDDSLNKHLKGKPICKPDIHLKKNRFKIFNEDSIEILHSFGYQCNFGNNLCVINENTLILVSGNYLNFLNINTKEETFLPSIEGVGFICVDAHPSGSYFAAAEKGSNFCINIFEYPALALSKTLKYEANIMKSHLIAFHPDGELLLSISDGPENKMFIWLWMKEEMMYETSDFESVTQHMHFLSQKQNQFLTSEEGYVRFWTFVSKRDDRDDIIEIQLSQSSEQININRKLNIYCTISLPNNCFISGTDIGYLLFFEGGITGAYKFIGLADSSPCHKDSIHCIIHYEDFLITFGSDGCIKFWKLSDLFIEEEGQDVDVESSESLIDLDTLKLSLNITDSDEDTAKNLKFLQLEPLKSFKISDNSHFLHAVLYTSDNDKISLLIQDLQGKVWKLDISKDLSLVSTICLISGLGFNLTDMAMCSVYPMIAATSRTGDVFIFDCIAKDIFQICSYNSPSTCITWPNEKLDGIGASFIVGFEDGIIRWLSVDHVENKKVVLKAISKPHNAAVQCVSFNASTSILVSQGMDSKLFFLYVENYNFLPMGFYINEHEVDRLEWITYFDSDDETMVY